MKLIALLVIAVCVSGCGSNTRTETNTVRKYKETTTAPDGQVTTRLGVETEESTADAVKSVDLTPTEGVSNLIGLVSNIFGGGGLQSIVMAILSATTAGGMISASGHKRQSQERKEDMEEVWQKFLKQNEEFKSGGAK